MSLYVGHLSPYARQDELERVFKRFGRCHFQLKDGYGFVVYEATTNAERALRALRGKPVCGEQIYLNWSNKQPRPFRPFRVSRFDEPYRKRAFREEDDAIGFKNSQDQREFSVDVLSPLYSPGGHQVDCAADKEAGHTHEDADSVRGNRGEDLADAPMDEDTELNPLEHDRWGGPASDILPGHGAGKGSDFDRYEPYHGYTKSDEKEGNLRASSDSSPHRGYHGKAYKEHFNVESERKFDKSMPPPICYNCGRVGHIKRKCPDGDVRGERYAKFEHMRDEMSFKDKMEGRFKKFRANSRGRISTNRDPFLARRGAWNRMEIHPIKGGMAARARSSSERRENRHISKPHSESQSKKETKSKFSSNKRPVKKRRAIASDTLSTTSDSSMSSSGKSRSKSISSSKSRSTSKSSTSRSRSASSRSGSISISSYAKSKSSRSRSRSISRSRSRSTPPRSLSLSVSLGQKSSSSLKNPDRNISPGTKLKENPENVQSPESKHFSILTSSEAKKTLEDESVSPPSGVKNTPNIEYSEKNSILNVHKSDFKASYNETDASFEVLNGISSAFENCPETSTPLGDHLMNLTERVSANSDGMSIEEMLKAFRHYGLVPPKDVKFDDLVENYFGAARLWPWEMIYYRRLKKGPISTENYAKRLEQNKEFGIVDRYIRSSSGWGEHQREV